MLNEAQLTDTNEGHVIGRHIVSYPALSKRVFLPGGTNTCCRKELFLVIVIDVCKITPLRPDAEWRAPPGVFQDLRCWDSRTADTRRGAPTHAARPPTASCMMDVTGACREYTRTAIQFMWQMTCMVLLGSSDVYHNADPVLPSKYVGDCFTGIVTSASFEATHDVLLQWQFPCNYPVLLVSTSFIA
jgi:hypothetical protein